METSFPNAFYISINQKKSIYPEYLRGKSMAISEDIGEEPTPAILRDKAITLDANIGQVLHDLVSHI